MAYRPKYIKQGDGSRCQWHNCLICSEAMAVDRHTRGAKVPGSYGVHVMRNYITPSTCPGVLFSQVRSATMHFYGVGLEYHWGDAWDTFVAGIKAGRGAAIAMQYSAVHGTPYDSCKTYNGRHGLFINEWRHNAALNRDEVLVYDPLADHRYSWIPQGPEWWPLSLLKKAMFAAAANYSGNLEWAFTKNTEWVNRHTTCDGARLRTGAGGNYTLKATVKNTDTLYTAYSPVSGGSYSFKACGVSKTGNKWYKVTAINGKSVSSLYGVSALYVCLGWF